MRFYFCFRVSMCVNKVGPTKSLLMNKEEENKWNWVILGKQQADLKEKTKMHTQAYARVIWGVWNK